MLYGNLRENERKKIKGIISKRRYFKEQRIHYLLKIADEKGIEISFHIYKSSEFFHIVQNYKEQDFVEVDMTLKSLNPLEANMHNISKCELIQENYIDENGLIAKFKSIIKYEVEDAVLKKILIARLNDEYFNKNFFTIPCSLKGEYSFSGGLLAKTVRVLEIVIKQIEFFNDGWGYNLTKSPKLSKDVCVTAIILDAVVQTYLYDIKEKRTGHVVLLDRNLVAMKIIHESNMEIIEKYRLSEKDLSILQHIVLAINPSDSFKPHQREADLVSNIYALDKSQGLYEQFDRTNQVGAVSHGLEIYYTETYKSKIRKKHEKTNKNVLFGDSIVNEIDDDKIGLKSAVNEFN